jgi:hypothetical protein
VHWPGRFRDQRWATAKQGGKKATTNCPLESTDSPYPTGNAEDIAPEVIKPDEISDCHN